VSANLDLVRSIYADWERGDYSDVHWAHPEIEFEWVGGLGGSWTGVAGMAEGWRDVLSTFDGWHTVPDEFRELDDERVRVLVRGAGRGKSSGAPIQHHGATLFHVRSGKVVRLVAYPEGERALADLGLEG
jgi:ketosteroid isomerase-like protein